MDDLTYSTLYAIRNHLDTRPKPLTFPIEEVEMVRIARLMSADMLISESEKDTMLQKHPEFIDYLNKYSTEEIAGHIRLWMTEWRC